MTARVRSHMPRRANADGFSLVEFMVAILLGTILVSGAIGVYLGSRRSYTESEQVAELAESARFSLALLETSLRHAGFFGRASAALIGGPGPLSGRGPGGDVLGFAGGAAPAVAGDCNGGAAAFDLDNLFFGVQAASANVLGCIDDAVAGTDVLVLKHLVPRAHYDDDPASATPTLDGVISFPTALTATEMYALVGLGGATLFPGTAAVPFAEYSAVNPLALAVFPYQMSIFYVRDTGEGTSTLARQLLRWSATAGSLAVETQDLVEGVENMQFLYGLDTDGDGAPNVFRALDGAMGPPWGQVVTVRVFLLVQSLVEEPGFTDTRTYTMGDVVHPPPDEAGGNRRRFLVSTDISLRNRRLALRGGS